MLGDIKVKAAVKPMEQRIWPTWAQIRLSQFGGSPEKWHAIPWTGGDGSILEPGIAKEPPKDGMWPGLSFCRLPFNLTSISLSALLLCLNSLLILILLTIVRTSSSTNPYSISYPALRLDLFVELPAICLPILPSI